MARTPDCRKKKHQRLSASADIEALTISEGRRNQWQDGHLATGVFGATDLTGNSGKKAILSRDFAEHDTESQQIDVGANKESTQSVLQSLKQTEKHGKKGIAKRKRLSASLPTNPLDIEKQQLHKLKATVEMLGGKLEDGWHVTSQRRSKNGLPFFSFISPAKERFRSRVEVVRHLGLPAGPAKRRLLSGNNQLALVPFDHQKKAFIKSSKASGIKNCKGLRHVGKVVSHAPQTSKVANDSQMTSTSCLSPAVITQRCQDILRSILSTEVFAAVSNMVSRGIPSPSMDATLQLKGPSFLASSLDLKLIHLRLATGAYGQSPELFSTDIQQVWKNIIAAGNELVLLASSLAELSENLYKQQITSLFDGISKKTLHASNTRNQQSIDDACVHVPFPERIIGGGPDGSFLRELPADVLVEDHGLNCLPSACQAMQARTKARYQFNKKLCKSSGKAKELRTSQAGFSCSSTESTCQKCGLNQGAECIVCNHCKASYHPKCVTSTSAAGEWCCPLCFLTQATENVCEWGTFNKGILDEERQKELLLLSSNATTEVCQGLQKSMGKAGICEACKKEDDNVLLCDACDAAYHMSCLSPPMESVPDGYWYCPACDEAGKRLIAFQQDMDVHNCAVCERVSRELLNCAENESTAQVFSKDTSPAYIAPERTMDHGYPERSLNPGVSEHCIENKAMDSDFFSGIGNVCKFCGLDEGENSILCSNCQNCFHLSCLTPALRKRPHKTWYCPSCLCRVCKIDVDDDQILLCDACDEGYHIYCLTPPLSEIPEEAWFCSSCIEAKPSKTEEPRKEHKSNEPRRSM